MGNSGSVDSERERNEVGASKQSTIEKMPTFVCADELGICTQSDSQRLPRPPNGIAGLSENDVARGKAGSDELSCNDKPSMHLAPQTTNKENRTSQEAVFSHKHDEIGEAYPEGTNKNARLLREGKPSSPNSFKEKAVGLVNGGQSQTTLEDQEQECPTHEEELGEQLYESISEWYPEQAEKLVGMLLELKCEHLKVLVRDEVLLKQKVQEAVCALESYQTGLSQNNGVCDVGEKQLLGDQVYDIVAKLYRDQAEQITGMLLEMDVKDLLLLVQREDLLHEKARHAYNTLHGVTEQESQHSCDSQGVGEELYKLVEEIHPNCADKLTGMLLEMNRECLENLMKNPSLLKEKIAEASLVLENTATTTCVSQEENEKQTIGEKLYAVVERLQPENADKITGMLLEMPAEELSALAGDQSLLEEKVAESLKALTDDTGSALMAERESLGEQLYDIIAKDLPDHAEIITGMLLEMDLGWIKELLQNPELLDEKVQVALNAVLHKGHSGHP